MGILRIIIVNEKGEEVKPEDLTDTGKQMLRYDIKELSKILEV